MSRLRRVVGNSVISLLGQLVTWTSTLLLTIAYGRFLGDTKFGELYFALAFVMLVGFPLEFGFNQQLTRDVAQEPEKAQCYLANILLIKGVLWLFFYGLILLICWLLGYNTEERILVGICGFTLLSTSIINTFASLHYAFERTVFPVVGTILEKGLSALIGILLLRQGADVETMALVLLGSSLTSAIWLASSFFYLEGIHLTIDRVLIRDLIRTSIPFLVYGVLGVIYYRLDTILLSLMTSAAVVGWYGAGYRLFDTLVFLPSLIISAIMYPVFSKLSVASEADLKVAIEKSMNFLLFCGIPTATVLIVAAPNIIGFLYHRSDFVHTFPVMQALAPGLVFLYANSVFSTTLMSIKREKKITMMAAIALVFNLVLNLILIPLYQHIGAAIVTSLTELLLLCTAIVLVPRHLLPLGSLKVGGKALLASLVMALTLLPLSTFSIFVILPLAMLIYLIVATIIGTIPREDFQAIYSAVQKKAQRTSPTTTAEEAEAQPPPDVSYEDVETVIIPVTPAGINWTDPSLIALRDELLQINMQLHTDGNNDDTVPVKAIHDQMQYKIQQSSANPLIPQTEGEVETFHLKIQYYQKRYMRYKARQASAKSLNQKKREEGMQKAEEDSIVPEVLP